MVPRNNMQYDIKNKTMNVHRVREISKIDYNSLSNCIA